MPLSALYAAVLACLQHLRASLVPSITCGNRTSRNPGGAERAAGTSSFGPRPLRPQRHAIAPCPRDGNHKQRWHARRKHPRLRWRRGEPIMQARVDRANGLGGGLRVLRNEPHAPCSKIPGSKVPHPAPRHHRVRLGTVVRRPLGAIRLALRCRHLCRDLAADVARGRCDERAADQSSFIRLSTSRPSRP